MEIKVTNNIGDQISLIHWHGLTQVNSSWMDGPILNQCPINTVNPSTGKMLNSVNNVNSMTYKLKPQASGTWWYHGHLGSQSVDGLAGTLVVEDTKEILNGYKSYGLTYKADVIYLLTDFYYQPAQSYLSWYLSPASGGDEPMPEQIAVNGLLSSTLVEKVNKADKLRVRLVGGAAFSMFNISVDGMALTVIELDGEPTVPFDVSYVIVNSGQRVSFVLDWSKLPKSMQNSPSVLFRVNAIPEMYPTYDPSLPNLGLYGTASGLPYNIHWTGRFLFNELKSSNNGNPTYNTLVPPSSPAKPPSDANLLQVTPLFSKPAPSPDLNVKFLIEFYDDELGVNRPHVNGVRFPDRTQQSVEKPPLFQYMSKQGGPLTYLDDPVKPLPKGSWIPGSGATPFVLPYKRTIDVWINNTDGGEHPMHLHGHTFWIIETSDYSEPLHHPVLRDTISIPAQGWARIRFVSDNPGVWFFHCHIDWHLEAGLAAYFIEAPSKLKGTINILPNDLKAECPSFFTPASTIKPSQKPTAAPSPYTKKPPTLSPSLKPSIKSSTKPTATPSQMLNNKKSPSVPPTLRPSLNPSFKPTVIPSQAPNSKKPTKSL